MLYEVQTAIRFKEIIQPPATQPPSPPDKILQLHWKKKFVTDICRNIQTFVFKVLQQCSSWASRNGTVPFLQMFFLAPSRSMFTGKFVKGK